MAPRFETHAFELLACAALMLGAFPHAAVQHLHVGRQPVAHALQLPEVEQLGAASVRRAEGRRHADVGKAIGDDP